jgi:general secretion pathway protein F
VSAAAAVRYRYRAAGRDGHVERGRLVAPNRTEAMREIAARGLLVIGLDEEQVAAPRGARLSAAELAMGLHVLSDLLDSGLPMARALAALEAIVSPAWRAALPGIRTGIREGRDLADALDSSPLVVSPLVLGIIRAGERGSGLVPALRSAADLCRARAETQSAVRNALAYPVLLAGAGTASVALLVGVVLPRFARILGDMGQELPTTTHLVLAMSAWARALALPALALGVVLALAWRQWTATPAGRRQWDAWLLGLPVIGAMRMAAASARLGAALSSLLASGVPFVAALQHAAGACGDAEIEARLLRARAEIIQGERPSRALERTAALTTLTVRMVQAGEESGRLVAMLSHAGRIEGEDLTQRLRTAVRLIEPMMILLFGGVVGLVAASLLQALYSVRPGA